MVYIVKWIELTGTSPLFHTPVKVFQHDWEGYTVYQLKVPNKLCKSHFLPIYRV